jgi:hypothetical protein
MSSESGAMMMFEAGGLTEVVGLGGGFMARLVGEGIAMTGDEGEG